jgi:hypothetical protein
MDDHIRFENLIRSALSDEEPEAQEITIDRILGYARDANIPLQTLNVLLDYGMSAGEVMTVVLAHIQKVRADRAST